MCGIYVRLCDVGPFHASLPVWNRALGLAVLLSFHSITSASLIRPSTSFSLHSTSHLISGEQRPDQHHHRGRGGGGLQPDAPAGQRRRPAHAQPPDRHQRHRSVRLVSALCLWFDDVNLCLCFVFAMAQLEVWVLPSC